jgi:hypothetical protein
MIRESVARHAEFERALQAFGWTVGRNLRIAHRYDGVDANRIANDAVDVAALGPDVIVTSGSLAIGPVLHAAPRTVPIVFVQGRGPGWCRVCREPVTSRRQCDRFHCIRIQLERKMAPAAQDIAPT